MKLTKRLGRFLLAPVMIMVWGCEWLPPSFGPDYFLTDKNWIEHIPLAAPPLASDSTGVDSSAIWDWSWRGKAGNSYQYMNLTPAAPTVETVTSDDGYTLASDTEVWRLELPNLFLNGNYEGTFDTAAYDPSSGSSVTVSPISAIHGNSLFISLDSDKDAYVAFLMDALVADVSATSSGNTYQLNMLMGQPVDLKYRHAPRANIATSINVTATPEGISGSRGALFISDSLTEFQDDVAVGEVFAINSPLQVTLDEIRIVRTNAPPYLRLLLAPWDTDPTPTMDPSDQDTRLTPGQYQFSVWLRTSEDDRLFSDATRTNQMYAARYATLSIQQVSYSSTTDSLESTRSNSLEVAIDSTWRRFVVSLMKPENMDDFDDMTPHPVMELAISPSQVKPLDAGAMLIAQPALNFLGK